MPLIIPLHAHAHAPRLPPRPRSSVLAWLLILVLSSLQPSFVDGQDRGSPTTRSQTPSQTQTQSAADLPHDGGTQLSQGDYASRQQATLEMWRHREKSREAVQRAARSPDPEISGRAEWILRQWRRGALPQTPPEISRLLARTDHSSAILRLMENGQFGAAVVAMEESAGTPMREEISRRVTSAMMQRFPVYVLLATDRESTQKLLRLVDLAADTVEMALCRLRLRQQLNLPITESALLPTSASAWPLIQQQRTRVILLATLGRYDQAIELAADTPEPLLLTRCRKIAGDWDTLAAEALQSAMAGDQGTVAVMRHWSHALVAATRSGDQSLVQKAIDHLVLSDEDAERLKTESALGHDDEQWEKVWNLRWQSLAVHGNLSPAMRILAPLSPADAADIWRMVSRPEEAFQVMEVPLDKIDPQLHRWISEATQQQVKSKESQLTADSQRMITLLRLLLTIGRDDAAWLIASRLNEIPVSENEFHMGDVVLETLLDSGKSEWAFELASRTDASEASLSQSRLQAIVEATAEVDEGTWEVVVKAMHTMFPRWSEVRRMKAAGELLRGEIPPGFQPDQDHQRLFNFIVLPRPALGLHSQRSGPVRLRATLEMADMFSRLDQTDLASATLQALAQSGDGDAVFAIANRSLDLGELQVAEKIFKSICDRVVSPRSSGIQQSSQTQGRAEFRGAYSNLAIVGKAMVGLWVVARSQQDDVRANQIEQQLRVLLCGPSRAMNRVIANYLSDRGETRWAMQIYEQMLAPQILSQQESLTFYQDTRRYALLAKDHDPASAAKWFDLATTEIIESDQFLPTAFVTLPVYVHRWSLEAAIDRKDLSEARYRVSESLKLDPMDIDLAERLLPQLREAGMEDLADETLLSILKECETHAKTFGRDAGTLNNIAWVAAVNQKHLDRALTLSRQSVRQEPDSAIYRDTLAEILFLMDQPKQALQMERDCVLDDPGQWHLHQQIDRFAKEVLP